MAKTSQPSLGRPRVFARRRWRRNPTIRDPLFPDAGAVGGSIRWVNVEALACEWFRGSVVYALRFLRRIGVPVLTLETDVGLKRIIDVTALEETLAPLLVPGLTTTEEVRQWIHWATQHTTGSLRKEVLESLRRGKLHQMQKIFRKWMHDYGNRPAKQYARKRAGLPETPEDVSLDAIKGRARDLLRETRETRETQPPETPTGSDAAEESSASSPDTGPNSRGP